MIHVFFLFVGLTFVAEERVVLKALEQRFREESHIHRYISVPETTRKMIYKGKRFFTKKDQPG